MKKLILILAVLLLCSVGYGADITAGGNGDWSVGGTWIGGTAPGIGDNAILGGFAIVFDTGVAGQHIQCDSITDPGASGDLNIDLSVLGDCAITCPGGIVAGTTTILDLDGAAPAATLTITSDLTGGAGSADKGLDFNTSGNVVLVGDLLAGGSSSHGILAVNAGDITITGNVTGASGFGIIWQSTGTLTINGNILASAAGAGVGLQASLAGTIIINGNINNGNATGLDLNNFDGTCTIVGNVISSGTSTTGSAIEVVSTSACDIHMTGNITAGAAHGIEFDGTGTLTVVGDITGSATNASKFGIDATRDSAATIIHQSGTVAGGAAATAYGIRNGDNPLTVNSVQGGSGLNANGVLNEGTELCTVTGSMIQGQAGSKPTAIAGGNFIFDPVAGKVVTDSAGTEAYTAGSGGGDEGGGGGYRSRYNF